ncbi:hypothetical protein K493DRAFT_357759 [Basidiobolus meristosporus CBS 931.73]|uniref:Ankyrin n=1 Tax=Basidiobolus meristosporus CBS 931.73 TaxID=1314790 RepID=A0A1Y1XVC9_9FUNG|nr:hypothetical protein K493DRAFT_357759 [Basidiobolus meristosporus CBS 931.73]|eukprot:ORX89708.1 hypothetical protein K493DRAFT_357759 [Basidiobolus meristosporus CBS 931.73]
MSYLNSQVAKAKYSSYEYAKKMVHLMAKEDIAISREVMTLVEVMFGNAENATMLVDSFTEPIETLPIIWRRALLHWACAKGCASLVSILEEEVDINQRDDQQERTGVNSICGGGDRY